LDCSLLSSDLLVFEAKVPEVAIYCP
jgi:hypothetical protein